LAALLSEFGRRYRTHAPRNKAPSLKLAASSVQRRRRVYDQ
jgi:hypothetical protein